MKANRLLTIMLLLQNQGKMTTKELAERLEISDRTICRDMEALSAAGVPVYAERGPLGGWALTEGYRTQLTGLTPQDILSLLLLQPSDKLDELGIRSDFETAFQKLLAASPLSLRNYAEDVKGRIYVDGAAWHPRVDKVPYLPLVQQAVWNDRKLHIRYPLPEELFEGEVSPLGLVVKRSVWYVVALKNEHLFFFRLSRLEGAQLLDETFVRPADFRLSAYWEQAAEQYLENHPGYRITLQIKESEFADLPPDRRERMLHYRSKEDGWAEVEMEFRSLKAAAASVMSFGALAKVLAPPELKQELLAMARAVIAQYGQDGEECGRASEETVKS